MTPPPPRSTLFPYTTLFRSLRDVHDERDGVRRLSELRGEALRRIRARERAARGDVAARRRRGRPGRARRSEEHTSELQSHSDLVCRLLLEKKKQRFPLHLAS